MSDFWTVLAAFRARCTDASSQFVRTAAGFYARAAVPEITRGKWQPGIGVAALRIQSDDEDVPAKGESGPARRPPGGPQLGRYRRMVELTLSVPLDADHVRKLEALSHGLWADFHNQPLEGAVRVEYAGSRWTGDDETTENKVMRVLYFSVLYDREGDPAAEPDLTDVGLEYFLKPGDDVVDAEDQVTL